MQRYSVTNPQIEIFLGWIKSGEIAIPEIQRPFVWDATRVRNFLDSLYNGYPVGYLISWRNRDVMLRDGTSAAGKKILIDGQQRVTALKAALHGQEVLSKDYKKMRIRIAFNPINEEFEVWNNAISKDSRWIEDISKIFLSDAYVGDLTDEYVQKNKGEDKRKIGKVIENVQKIVHNTVGLIELADDLDIETVTQIFIRVNSEGVGLSQADFAMSKIAVNEQYGGNLLRKAIDYFCHLIVRPDYIANIEKNDKDFTASGFWPNIKWLKDHGENLYEPSYTDILRVAFAMEFGRGKLADLVALLSGRNFETRDYEERIIEESFTTLRKGIESFINKTNFDRFTIILKSAGFCSKSLITSNIAISFAYIIYLRGRADGLSANEIKLIVRRWYAMSILTGRYSGSPESIIDADARGIKEHGLLNYCNALIDNELHEQYWTGTLVQNMITSNVNSPFFIAYLAAQVYLGDKGFLSSDDNVEALLTISGDKHHIYPKNHLKKEGLPQRSYNQIANFTPTLTEINRAIGDKEPTKYFGEILDQVTGGPCKYGGITDMEKLKDNFEQNCIPESMLGGQVPKYDDFLSERRRLMALRVKKWFNEL